MRPPVKLAMSSAGQYGPDELGHLVEALDDGVGHRELIDRRELRHDGALRREEEAVGNAVRQGDDEQHPRLTTPLSTSAASRVTRPSRADVGADHHAARREACR